MTTADALLRAQEAKGLQWSMAARLVFCLAVILLGIRDVLGLTIFGSGIALAGYGIHVARQERYLRGIGIAGVSFDLLLLSLIATLLQDSYDAAEAPAGLLLKGPIIYVMIDLIVINALALRPLYPALVAGGSLLIQSVVIVACLQQEGVVLTDTPAVALYTPAISHDTIGENLVTIALIGFFLTLLSHAARKLLQNVVDLEIRNQRILEEQARSMMDFRIAGLANVVSGVAHELNTPLGASMSSADTVAACAKKLVGSLDLPQNEQSSSQEKRTRRLLRLLEETSLVIKDAGQRMHSVVLSLKEFSRLDEAEVQQSDIRAGLKSALTLFPSEARGEVEIVEDYQDVPEIMCRPKELNQAFHSLFRYCFGAMQGEGELHVDVGVEEESIAIRIRYTSDGMPEDELRKLFEVGFTLQDARMGMNLELPTARLVLERHGGSVSINSEVGIGNCFAIRLPIENDLSVDPPLADQG